MRYIFFLLLGVPAFCSSCYHVYYAPNTANAPLLYEKREARVNGLIATGMESEFIGAELQSAYAVSNNCGIMLNLFTGGKSRNSGSYIEKGSGSYVEAGTGFFAPFSKNKIWIVEIFGGMGLGTVTNDYGHSDYSRVGITKFFVQPAVGYKSKFIEIALVAKLSQVKMKVKEFGFNSSDNDYARHEIIDLMMQPKMFAFEPAFIFRGGGENFKISLGLSFCNSKVFSYTQPHETVNASIGASVSLRAKKRSVGR